MITHAGAYHHQQSREAEDAGDMDVRETQAPAHWRKDDKKKGLPGGENRQLCPGCRGFKVQTCPRRFLLFCHSEPSPSENCLSACGLVTVIDR
ncbi:hypothetical protein FQZ97_627740 [compost metagenome]